MEANPWDIPDWHALGREASLVRHLIGSGATALGKANYADRVGDYYTAFFGLSVGIERLSKLILVAEFAIKNSGKMPDQKKIKKFGHNLIALIERVEDIQLANDLSIRYQKPRNETTQRMLQCLDAFADARRGRYANFASLGDPNLSDEDPVSKWWSEVAESILSKHYYGKRPQERVESNAEFIDSMISPFTSVHHTDETGNLLHDVKSASIRTGQTEIVQKYGRFYVLTIIRWLSDVLSKIARIACYRYGAEGFFGIEEYFFTYTVEDSFLKTRKIWPLGTRA
ncbi:hypothetical protein D3260_06275 [Salinisphaera sp. Q1T1-3]|nr:hypothetical protein D3260_06275 [Salinisphaera sp. Q1T1-3]